MDIGREEGGYIGQLSLNHLGPIGSTLAPGACSPGALLRAGHTSGVRRRNNARCWQGSADRQAGRTVGPWKWHRGGLPGAVGGSQAVSGQARPPSSPGPPKKWHSGAVPPCKSLRRQQFRRSGAVPPAEKRGTGLRHGASQSLVPLHTLILGSRVRRERGFQLRLPRSRRTRLPQNLV
jgi:hypothetical protein